MSERKVLQKYYPADFDPSKITRTPKHLRQTGPKVQTVRLMAPFSMKCTACGEYIYKGRKFNARKETTDEKYLNITIYRFYIRCTRCSGEIRFKTDPKNMDYTCESGAKRNFEPWRENKEELAETDEQRLDRLEREEAEEEELKDRNAMEELEEKMQDSKREMQIADALDEIRTRNARIERGERAVGSEVALSSLQDRVDEERARAEKEDGEAAKLAFAANNVERVMKEAEEEEQRRNGNGHPAEMSTKDAIDAASMPPPSFERVKRVKKPLVPGLVKKAELVKTAPAPPPPSAPLLGLGDYDSD